MNQIKISFQEESIPGRGGFVKKAVSNQVLDDLFARTPFSREALERLGASRVVIFGVGSGGGKLAVYLGEAGVGTISLVDPGILKAHNLARHIGTARDIGRIKVDVVSDVVLLHNPTVTLELYPFDCFALDSPTKPEAILEGADLVIGATDRTSVQLAINTIAWRMGIPGLFGGCYEAARGGEVFFTLPGEGTPCLACLRAGLQLPERQGPFDYSAVTNAEDFIGEPGLSAAVDLVTCVEAQIALGILLRSVPSRLGSLILPAYNFLLIGGALANGFYLFRRPFHIFWQPLRGPRPDCEVCQSVQGVGEPCPEVDTEMPAEYLEMLADK